jgi:hypothetical protein
MKTGLWTGCAITINTKISKAILIAAAIRNSHPRLVRYAGFILFRAIAVCLRDAYKFFIPGQKSSL